MEEAPEIEILHIQAHGSGGIYAGGQRCRRKVEGEWIPRNRRDSELLPLLVPRWVRIGEKDPIGVRDLVEHRRGLLQENAVAGRIPVVRGRTRGGTGPHRDSLRNRVEGRPRGKEGCVGRVRIVRIEIQRLKGSAIQIAVPDHEIRLYGLDIQEERERPVVIGRDQRRKRRINDARIRDALESRVKTEGLLRHFDRCCAVGANLERVDDCRGGIRVLDQEAVEEITVGGRRGGVGRDGEVEPTVVEHRSRREGAGDDCNPGSVAIRIGEKRVDEGCHAHVPVVIGDVRVTIEDSDEKRSDGGRGRDPNL